MRRAIISAILSAIVMMASIRPSDASIVPVLDLRRLTDSADIVAVGEVVSVSDGGVESVRVGDRQELVRRETCHLRVERLLKGSARSTHLGVNWWMLRYAQYGYPFQGQFGVFFLRRGTAGLTFADPSFPVLTALPDGRPAGGSVYHRIVCEIAHVLSSTNSLPDERKTAVRILATVRDDGASTRALRLAASTDGEEAVRTLALAALLSRNDITLLQRAADTLLNSPADAIAHTSGLSSLAASLRLVKDPAAVLALAGLMRSPSIWVRQGAVYALAHIGTEAAIDPLIKALFDSDQDVRFYAVSGLARITGQDKWGPGPSYYKPREDYYLAHWREWAKER